MRFDNLGMFWEDITKVKELKAPKPKRTPPEPTWLADDYLPNLDEARGAHYEMLTNYDMTALAQYRTPVVFDIESYPNYFLLALKPVGGNKFLFFEDCDDYTFNPQKLLWCLQNFRIVGFNSEQYDMPVATLAGAGAKAHYLQWATEQIIMYGRRPHELLKECSVKQLKDLDHIDLIQITALAPGLKKLAGRLHGKRMQDLPFKPGIRLSLDQRHITKWYCANDLANTELVFNAVAEELHLRERLGKKYHLDLRSKSDAQIAEAIISTEVRRRKNVKKLVRTEIEPGTKFKYNMPGFIQFRSYGLRSLYDDIIKADFIVAESGNIDLPDALTQPHGKKGARIGRTIGIAGTEYQMGLGGLHSKEKNVAHVSDAEFIFKDRDVTSYYPRLILNSRLLPRSMGEDFWQVYNTIIEDRVAAKHMGDKVTADGLKIVGNGTFGKLLNRWSMMYSPDLGIQTTVTGQLSLLMLIERLEWVKLHVVSANTDGIIIKCPRHREAECDAIIAEWEKDTGFTTEETRYKAVYSRDVNNYIAVYETPQKGERTKVKGIFTKGDRAHNPANQICTDAVVAMILDGTPVEKTIRECSDIRKFVTVRLVNGGAVKNGEYLGKYIRWYYATDVEDEIIIAKTGGIVARSLGAQPLMLLPDSFPQNVNFDWYIQEAYQMLKQLTYLKDEPK